MRTRTGFVGMGIAAVALCAAPTFAGKPGGGGTTPPADPAISYRLPKSRGDELWVMNADGTNATKVAASISGHASWSPDGQWLAYASVVDGVARLYVVAKTGGTPNPILTLKSGYAGGSVAWSPGSAVGTGSWIAYVDCDPDVTNATYDIFLVRPDGSDAFNLTNSPSRNEFNPTWSPESGRLGCSAESDALVLQLTASGGRPAVAGVSNLTADGPLAGAKVSMNSWAKRSNKIAVHAYWPTGTPNVASSLCDVYVLELTQGDAVLSVTNVTATDGLEERLATWSSDDSQLAVFNLGGPGFQKGVHVISASGPGPTTLRAAGGISPDWRR